MADEKEKPVETTKKSVPSKPPAGDELSESDVEKVAGGGIHATSPAPRD